MDDADLLIEELNREDDLGAVVRSHIRLEQLLIKFVESRIKKPSSLKRLSLDYDGYVALALALGLKADLGPLLNALGSLRNKFAHTLLAALDSQAAKVLYSALPSEDKVMVRHTYAAFRARPANSWAPEKFSDLAPSDRFKFIAMAVWVSLERELPQQSQEKASGA